MPKLGEAPITEYLFQKLVTTKVPLSGTFELSPVCNFDCKMCYVRKSAQEVQNSPRRLMTKEQWLDIARQAKEQGMLYLLLTGGEPFLVPYFRELYEELIHMGFLVSINTNGSLIDDKTIAWLKELPPTRINITLYGASNETYEALCGVKGMFDRVDRAITGLRAAGIAVKLNCSLTPFNVGDMERIVAYANDRNVLLKAAVYMFPPVRRDETMIGQNQRFTAGEAARYQEKLFLLQNGPEWYDHRMKAIAEGSIPPPGLDESCVDPIDGKVRCRAGKACFWITWDGWVAPCGMMNEPKADITVQSFADAWKKTTAATDEIKLSGVCAGCADRQLCHACAAMALAETGAFSGIPQYLCKMAEEMRAIAREYLEANPE